MLYKNPWPTPPSLSSDSDCELFFFFFFFCKSILAALIARKFLLWNETYFSVTSSFVQGSIQNKTHLFCFSLRIFEKDSHRPWTVIILAGRPGSSASGREGSLFNVHSLDTSQSEPLETNQIMSLPGSDLAASHRAQMKHKGSTMTCGALHESASDGLFDIICSRSPSCQSAPATRSSWTHTGPSTCNCFWWHLLLPRLHPDWCSDGVETEPVLSPPLITTAYLWQNSSWCVLTNCWLPDLPIKTCFLSRYPWYQVVLGPE